MLYVTSQLVEYMYVYLQYFLHWWIIGLHVDQQNAIIQYAYSL